MSSETKNCPQCGEAFEGRPNKKFCGDTCKGRHFRENNPLVFQVDSPAAEPVKTVNSSVSSYHPEYSWQTPRAEEDQEEKEEAEEKRIAEQEHANKLHGQFCGVVREFLELEYKSMSARQVNKYLQKVADLAASYASHPHIKRLDNLVSSRLKSLYGIHDILQEVLQEIEGKMLWQSKEGEFEITKKWRKALREMLIPD